MNDCSTCRSTAEGRTTADFKLALPTDLYEPRLGYLRSVLDVMHEDRWPGLPATEFFTANEPAWFDSVYSAHPLIDPALPFPIVSRMRQTREPFAAAAIQPIRDTTVHDRRSAHQCNSPP